MGRGTEVHLRRIVEDFVLRKTDMNPFDLLRQIAASRKALQFIPTLWRLGLRGLYAINTYSRETPKNNAKSFLNQCCSIESVEGVVNNFDHFIARKPLENHRKDLIMLGLQKAIPVNFGPLLACWREYK